MTTVSKSQHPTGAPFGVSSQVTRPGAIAERLDSATTGGREMVHVAVPEEYLPAVQSLIREKEGRQPSLNL